MRKWINLIAESQATVTLYHGTCEGNAAALVTNGWQPNQMAAGGNMGQTRYLYLTTDPDDARWFANEKGCDSIVAVHNIPMAALLVDPEDGSYDTLADELNSPHGLPGKVVLTRSLGPEHFSHNTTLREAMGNRDRTFYHVTLLENLTLIMAKGLVPTSGARSQKLGEQEAIFLFTSREDAEDAVMNWLGDEFDDDAVFVLLEVILPAETAVYRDPNSNAEWEVFVKDRIPPDCIHILEKNL